MAHLRLFQPQRGTQSLRFPDHDFPVMRTYAALAAQTRALSNWKTSSRPCSARPSRSPWGARHPRSGRCLVPAARVQQSINVAVLRQQTSGGAGNDGGRLGGTAENAVIMV